MKMIICSFYLLVGMKFSYFFNLIISFMGAVQAIMTYMIYMYLQNVMSNMEYEEC